MKLSQTTALALLAIDSAFALKEARRQSDDTTVRITLSSQSTETGTQVSFDAVNSRVYDSPRGSTLFETIDIFVGAGAQQDLRCQAIGMAGAPLVATRGNNTYVSSRLQEYTVRSFADIRTGSDITFSDADKGPWTFRVPSAVGEIVCDPAFEAAGAEDSQVRVILSNPAEELATQTVFDDVSIRTKLSPVGSRGPFHTVEISVGALVNPSLRCQILNRHGMPIVATRGANTDVTFSDADKGPWRLLRMRKVSKIICDPNFVARPQ